MWRVSHPMKLLFVHDRYGSFAGAEANILHTARELKERGHTLGLLHGPITSHSEEAWDEVFTYRAELDNESGGSRVHAELESFQPEIVYIHKMADLPVLTALLESEVPKVRM